ncbi:HEAT repeat domain-containing protein [Umezakia ovalisporum]|uniref:HEAT repeat domain-containing protein n=1 Tax=Umezakia ovalisporum FSS-43 TaxID=2740520 RepID=A0ABT6K2T9_9CYAN|nr:HEAT repeat domain-containing protein [Umezakia ovalisporum]MDH6056672.1 HEAT repeat domain-containing protein [Umezakia ovalisporum FSS-43]MDH6068628.1 HEAT repeat domain-containing protein [Umezakia ovalisporum APH033B]MDH6070146.1 HEAT repeat domain-containing protein [Umezakia ovalisporum CobakiLakeA]MDH6077755.1 HEAT repeat domain-containing protein [Umezakia ovalisporum FSS-45]MDH6079875.1 HEAT repeat domain-containing protein [Umezakia ovalisporum FSS-44]
MVNSINQLLVQAQTAYAAADWSLLTQYLQELIFTLDSTQQEIVKHREYLLELALSIFAAGSFQQRWDVAKIFRQLGDIAIPPLIDILKDENAEENLRWYAARTLAEFDHPDVIVSLVDLLKTTENEELKALAASALGQMGTTAITVLTPLLAEEETKLLAVRSLAYIGTKESITPLLSVVQDSQAAVRTTALEALSSFHDEDVLPALLNALDDVAATVRRAAVLGLGFRRDLSTELDLVARLQPRLFDFNLDVCCAAAMALSRMGSDAAAKHLFEVLISPHTPFELQLQVIRALMWVETLSGLTYLHQALDQSTSEILWQEMITVLGQVQNPQLITPAAEILLDVLQSQHLGTFANAVQAKIKSLIALGLGELGNNQAVEPLILLLADDSQVVRLNAMAALKKLDKELVYQQLQELANNLTLTPDLQQRVTIALAEW